ncbi:hypothetical protein GW17_00012866 [Ensete ventricosum]|nr:hypothetical protein GW17_00012866 [Ensete ventricosum]
MLAMATANRAVIPVTARGWLMGRPAAVQRASRRQHMGYTRTQRMMSGIMLTHSSCTVTVEVCELIGDTKVTHLRETRVVIKAVEMHWMVEDQANEASVDETEEQKVALQPVQAAVVIQAAGVD